MISRFARCLAAGAAVAAAMAVDAVTAGYKTLAAQAAAGHQSTAAVVALGSITIAVLLGVAFFMIASAAAWSRSAWRARRARAAPDGAQAGCGAPRPDRVVTSGPAAAGPDDDAGEQP
jgi:hypothetical protein